MEKQGLRDAVYREFARQKLRDAVELARKVLDDSSIKYCVEIAIEKFNKQDEENLADPFYYDPIWSSVGSSSVPKKET